MEYSTWLNYDRKWKKRNENLRNTSKKYKFNFEKNLQVYLIYK
jgi:hypothetical protein